MNNGCKAAKAADRPRKGNLPKVTPGRGVFLVVLRKASQLSSISFDGVLLFAVKLKNFSLAANIFPHFG